MKTLLIVFQILAISLLMAQGQLGPRIDTFPAPNGLWSIDHHSQDNGWDNSFLVLRHPKVESRKPFATISAAIQGAPIWSPDSHSVIFNTGYSTYMAPVGFTINEAGVIQKLSYLDQVPRLAQKQGKIPQPESVDYDHTYLRCRYYDDETKAFWFTFFGDFALKGGSKLQHVERRFCIKLSTGTQKLSFHDNLPRPLQASAPPRPAAFGLIASGTGFLIDKNKHILTNYHVVAGWSNVKVDTATSSYEAVVSFADEKLDVAILTVAALPDIEPIGIDTSASPVLSDEVFTIGFPNTTIQGFSAKFTKGEISALAGSMDDPSHFQVSVPVQPGNSGGPLVTSIGGKVIGIIDAKLNTIENAKLTGDIAQNVNYAIKASAISKFLHKANIVPALPPQTSDPKSAVSRTEKATFRISTYGIPPVKK